MSSTNLDHQVRRMATVGSCLVNGGAQAVGDFRFISVQNSDRETRRLAQSHAVRRALENKRKLQKDSGQNFRIVSLKEKTSRRKPKPRGPQHPISSLSPLPADLSSSLHALMTDSSRLQAWLRHYKVTIFNATDELVLQNLLSVLGKHPGDPALLSATMLTFAFAATGAIDKECLGYQTQAMSSIRARMNCLDSAASESTLGAILLLAGIEARLGMPMQVQLHMTAVQRILGICQTQGAYLTDRIKRAIFWQDLNTSVMTGSNRVVDHTTFAELQWRRDPFVLNDFILPSGFDALSYLLTSEFVEVLQDVHALRCIREYCRFGVDDVMSMAQVDNHQASIQSRLISMPSNSPFAGCCHVAAYLCSTTLRCKIWRASTVPPHLSSMLLHKLQRASQDPAWENHPAALLWLLYIGGAFAPAGTIRSGYAAMLRGNQSLRFEGMGGSWAELVAILKQFIWSEKAFHSQVESFWKEIACRE